MVPRGKVKRRLAAAAKAHGVAQWEFIDRLIEKLGVSRQPLIVRDRATGDTRGLLARRLRGAPDMPRQSEEALAYETPGQALVRHLQENFASIDELLK